MQLTPKFSGQIRAICAKEDILIEKGEYLLIDESDNFTIVSEAMLKILFDYKLDGKADAKPSVPVRKKNPKAGLRAMQAPRLNPNSPFLVDLSGVCAKIILAFGPDNSGKYLEHLTAKKIYEIGGFDKMNSLTGRIWVLKDTGFLAHTDTINREFGYSLTAKGMRHSEKLRKPK